MSEFFDRLDKYMVFKHLNDNKISIDCNISNGLIGKARKRGSLSQENISKILLKYSDLDANWLMAGKGEMLTDENKSINSELISINKGTIEVLKEVIMRLQHEVISIQSGMLKSSESQ